MITNKRHHHQIQIDLTGPDGNAFVLLGKCKQLGKVMDMSNEEIKALQDRMMSGDYENLITEFDKAFGDIVTLIR